MGVFTRLGEGEVAEILTAYGLGRIVRTTPIAAGTINSNYAIETQGSTYFLRVNEGKAEVDVAWEARLVRALADADVPTPAPLVALDGRAYVPLATDGPLKKWVSLFPWRAGRHLAPEEVTQDHALLLGIGLARLHVAGLALPAGMRRGSIYDEDHLQARFSKITSVIDPQLRHATEVCGDELARAAAQRDVRRRATFGLIHGDLFRDNVLWEAGEISAILDFEQASGGSLAYDLAVCLNDWCWTAGAPNLNLARALLDGYQRVRPLTPEDARALPIEVRLAATRFTITRITDVYLARVTNPDKDFRAFLARVEAWRGPALGALTALL